MRKLLTFFAIVMMSFMSYSQAEAVVFTGTAVGSWSNVVSTHWQDVYSISNGDVGETADFYWGDIGAQGTTNFNNRFRFDGVGSDAGDSPWSTSEESPFLIGNFSYCNGSVTNALGVDGVTLDILLNILTPVGVTDNYAFAFNITNTPNNTGDPVLDGDIVSVANSLTTTAFHYDGYDYTLELLGFSSDGGQTIRTDFSSPEGATAFAGVYARIHQVPTAIPEPATVLLLGSGLVGFFVRRKRG